MQGHTTTEYYPMFFIFVILNGPNSSRFLWLDRALKNMQYYTITSNVPSHQVSKTEDSQIYLCLHQISLCRHLVLFLANIHDGSPVCFLKYKYHS